jgi:hypothetical protein
MKVGIYETVEVSDEQRGRMADLIDDKATKRQATRDEMKELIWRFGSDWAGNLEREWNRLFGDGDDPAPDDDGLLDPAEPDADLGDLI